MSNEHDWLSKCVKEIDVTDVGEKYYSVPIENKKQY